MTDLTTVANVQAFLGLPAGQDAPLLQSLVTAASTMALTVMNRNSLLTATYTENYNGGDKRVLLLTNAPVTAVASVTVDGIAIPVSTSPTLDGYVFDTYRLLLRGYTYMFTRGYQNVTVQYSAGFSATPMDVQQAVTELAAFKYQRRKQLAVGSKTLAGQTEMFVQKDMPPEAVTIFKNYARVFIG